MRWISLARTRREATPRHLEVRIDSISESIRETLDMFQSTPPRRGATRTGGAGRLSSSSADSPALTCSNVGIAQDVGLEFQIVQTMFDHVADANYTGELAVMDHRHVAHAVAGHQVHHVRDSFGRG